MTSKNSVAVILLVMAWYGAAVPAPAHGTQNYPITGVHTNIGDKSQGGAIGPRPVRRNIFDMQNDIPAWSLYIQALQKMQSTSEDDYLSWFQIAGIHGRPYIPWQSINQAPNAPLTGYCFHNSVLFLTWHRPYLALFEQVLASYCQEIAGTYPQGQLPTYQAAANNFRIPFWDWAANNQIPPVVNTPNVTITTPSGIQSVANPLFQYTFQTFPEKQAWFPSNSNNGDGFLASYRQTVRGVSAPGGPGNPASPNSWMNNYPFMSVTWNALVKSTSFDNFATTAAPGPSIEEPHDEVHSLVGGWGHMALLSYAAFDPIFMLHHANIDRLFALWQAINPTTWLTPLRDQSGTFTIPPNTMEDSSTPLEPFKAGNGGWYTSDSCRSMGSFGYTYPEIDDWDQTPVQLQANVTATINALYNPFGSSSKRALMPGQQTVDWSVDLRVSKFDLQGERFIIRVFLGQVPEDPEDWFTSTKCVGSFRVSPPPHNGEGPFPEVLTYSEISLVKGLSDKGIDGDDVEGTVEYLKGNFAWMVQKSDGSAVPTEQVPSLRVTVQDEVVTMPGAITELPKYGKKTLHPVITQGKAGGYSGTA